MPMTPQMVLWDAVYFGWCVLLLGVFCSLLALWCIPRGLKHDGASSEALFVVGFLLSLVGPVSLVMGFYWLTRALMFPNVVVNEYIRNFNAS